MVPPSLTRCYHMPTIAIFACVAGRNEIPRSNAERRDLAQRRHRGVELRVREIRRGPEAQHVAAEVGPHGTAPRGRSASLANSLNQPVTTGSIAHAGGTRRKQFPSPSWQYL